MDWTASAYVTPMLPTNYAAGLTAQGTTLAAKIAEATGIAQGDFEVLYYRFPEVGDTPATLRCSRLTSVTRCSGG